MSDPMPQPVTWSVGRQSHATQFNEVTPVTGVNVPVVLSTGETFTVFVPDDTYRQGTAAVRELIQRDVDAHVAVANLTGTAGG